MVMKAVLRSRRSNSWRAVMIRREPVAPTGCPRAIAPPFTFSLSTSGSKTYEEVFESGTAFESVSGRPVEPYMTDGNYVIASRAPKPWRKQAGILLAYLYFYNPLRFLAAVVRPKNKLYLMDAGVQLTGMMGLVRTARRTLGWLVRLWRGPIKRARRVPTSPIPYARLHSTRSPATAVDATSSDIGAKPADTISRPSV